jgi:phosphoglycolate phosphatase
MMEYELKNDLVQKIHNAIDGKEHVIWDWNGTLLDDVGHAVVIMNSLLVEHQLPLLDRDRYRKVFEFPVLNYYKNLGFDFDKESFENLCHRFVDRFMAGFHSLPLIPEMKSVVLQLQEDRRMQSILSATDQLNLESMVSHFELSNTFRFVFGINNKLASSKIERGHELIQESGLPLNKTVIIGDTLHDLEVARALGIDAVLISHGHQCPTRLRPHHEMVIEV